MATHKHPGQWKAGESGNPKGRPPGTGAVAKLRQGIAGHLSAIIGRLVEQAIEGDTGAAKLLLERTVPALKAAELAEPLALPDGSLTEQGRAVLAAVADGRLAPGQAAQLLAGLGALARVTELDELSARLDALENRT